MVDIVDLMVRADRPQEAVLEEIYLLIVDNDLTGLAHNRLITHNEFQITQININKRMLLTPLVNHKDQSFLSHLTLAPASSKNGRDVDNISQ